MRGVVGLRRGAALAAAVVLAPLGAGAAPPFVWPVDCTHGEDRRIVRHVDRDPDPGMGDVACAGPGGDGHRGTDIALADLAALARRSVAKYRESLGSPSSVARRRAKSMAG